MIIEIVGCDFPGCEQWEALGRPRGRGRPRVLPAGWARGENRHGQKVAWFCPAHRGEAEGHVLAVQPAKRRYITAKAVPLVEAAALRAQRQNWRRIALHFGFRDRHQVAACVQRQALALAEKLPERHPLHVKQWFDPQDNQREIFDWFYRRLTAQVEAQRARRAGRVTT